MFRSSYVAARLTLALCALAPGLAVAADQGVLVRSGDRVMAQIVPGDEDAFDFDLLEGGALRLAVTAVPKSGLHPAIRLHRPDGAEVDLASLVSGSGGAAGLDRLEVPPGQTGRWQLRVTGADATIGGYRVAATITAPPPTHLRDVALAAGARVEVTFPADSGWAVTSRVRVLSGSRPARVRVTDPQGQDVPGSEKSSKRLPGGRVQGRVALEQGLGVYKVVVEGSPDADARIDVDVAVTFARRGARRVTLPPEPALDPLEPVVVRQGDEGVAFQVGGSDLLPGTAATIDGDGVDVRSADLLDAHTLKVKLDVASDAPFGARRLVVLPPRLLGESAALDAAVVVHAPDPTLDAAFPAILEQGTSGTLTLAGSGFRAGGTVTTAGAGVTFSAPTWISDTEFTATYTVSPDAALEPIAVTYTQPEAGGAAAVTLTAASLVMPHGPVLSSMSPSVVSPGGDHAAIRVSGDFFNQGTAATFSGSGVTVNSCTFVNATTLDLDVSVRADAAVGPRDVTIAPAPGGGPSHAFAGALTVAAAEPAVLGFSHAALARGAGAVGVTVTGREFRPGDVLAASGTGVTFRSVAILGTDRITALADVDGGAATGLRDVTVTHAAALGERSGTLAAAFVVTDPVPTVVSVGPGAIGVTGAGGPTRDVPIRIAGTNFMTGAAVTITRSGGTGLSIVAGSAQVASPTRIDVTISVASGATTGAWDVTVANPGTLGNSGTSGAAALDVKPSTSIAVNRVIASSGRTYGGERVTIQGSGFATGCAVDFGSVRAFGTQVLDANTLVTTVPPPASASSAVATSVDVKATNPGGAAASLAAGYTYAKDEDHFVTLSTVPAQGAQGVPRNLKSAVVVLSAPLDPATGVYGTIPGTHTFWYEMGGNYTAYGARGVGPQGRFLVFTRFPFANLELSGAGAYVLDIPTSLRSLGGTAFTPTRLSAAEVHDQQTFTVSPAATDATAPALSAATPANGSTNQDPTTRIALTFSEALDPLTITGSTITLQAGASAVAASVSLSDDLTTVTLTPQSTLAPNTTYTAGATSAVADLCGNAIAAVAITFTTSNGTDTVKPVIDAVVIESLPSSLDGSGTYVSPSGAPGQNFDLCLPRSGWSIGVAFSDAGGAGIDETSFSAKCSVAVGANAAGAELASQFTVTSTGASWRIPAASPVAAGGGVSFTFLVKDKSGNAAASRAITVDVADADSAAANGGDLDPLDSRRTWVLRTDVDAFAAAYASTSVPSAQRGATTTVAANGLLDLDEALRLVGLNTGAMTAQAAATQSGGDVGTNAIVRRLFAERVRELLNERFDIGADGSRRAGSVDVEFLLPGELGSLSTAPVYSTASSSNSSKSFSEISLGGTVGAEASAYTASGKVGDAWFDERNRREEANVNVGGATDTGIYLLGAFKLQVNANALFRARVSQKLVAVHGGTPVGEDASDDDVLAGSFDRVSSSNAALNARYDAILDAIEAVALYASAVTAHEIGHSLGLVADGAPGTGTFGAAHYANAFTEATSASPNTSRHLDYLGNDLMAGATTFDATTRTGADFKRFGPLDLAYLRNRLLYDEGK